MCAYLPLPTRKNFKKLSENLFGCDKYVNVNTSTNLWTCWVRRKAARPVPNRLHVFRRCIQLGTVGRPEAGHDFSISCPWNILPQCWTAARVCIHLGAVCHVGVLCCRCRVGFHCPTGHIHLHLQTDRHVFNMAVYHRAVHVQRFYTCCVAYNYSVRQYTVASWHA